MICKIIAPVNQRFIGLDECEFPLQNPNFYSQLVRGCPLITRIDAKNWLDSGRGASWRAWQTAGMHLTFGMERSSLLKTMRSALETVYGRRLRGILLYGSEARGEARTDSDMDVLVLLDRVAEYGEDVWRCLEALCPLALKLGRRISPKPVDAQQYESLDCPLYRQVHREGIAA